MGHLFSYPLFFLAGSLSGMITGSIPGLHVNLIATIFLGVFLTSQALSIGSLQGGIFIASMAITHTFFDIVPTLFLGVPGEESHAILPGHQLVLEGKGLWALRLSIMGSLIGLIFGAILLFLLLLLSIADIEPLTLLESLLLPYMAFILGGISLLLLLSEKKKKRWAMAIFLLSGLYGLFIFNTPLIPGGSTAPFTGLFPALSGLFGLSSLIYSLMTIDEKTKEVALQEEAPSIFEYSIYGLTGGLGGVISGLLPGLGPANIAAILSVRAAPVRKKRERDKRGSYTVFVSSISTANALFAISALYFLGRTRSGASIALKTMVGELPTPFVVVIGISMLGAGLIAYYALHRAAPALVQWVTQLDSRGLPIAVIGGIVSLVYFSTGGWGLLILAGSTCLGLVAPSVGVRRSHAMGLFLVPTILFYSGLTAPLFSILPFQRVNIPAQEIELTTILSWIFISLLLASLMYIVTTALRKKGFLPFTKKDT